MRAVIWGAVGRNCIINNGSTVDHDCVVAEGVHVAPGCHVGGHVAIGALTLVGIGSSPRDRIRVGARVVLGAGSVVVAYIPDATLAYGVPARAIRDLSDDRHSRQATTTISDAYSS